MLGLNDALTHSSENHFEISYDFLNGTHCSLPNVFFISAKKGQLKFKLTFKLKVSFLNRKLFSKCFQVDPFVIAG
jgi:hypothetical protein